MQKTVDELAITAQQLLDSKIQGGSEASNKLDNFKQMQDELEDQTQKLQEV